ncbi:MAG: hypothetical protein A2V77_15830 [Anaeromyxobacter sp. RBG_16_69_14]|nr:MAG: hypothetical protein A2V77_15830 [Anaeromyxobacter sp. RBG_16_69_14]
MRPFVRAGARILPFTSAALGSLRPWAAITLAVGLAACSSNSGSDESAEDEDVTLGKPTHSQPIKLAPDGRLVWVVNPASDSVSVIRADTYAKIATIPVGDEPQSITLRPRKNDYRKKFPYDAYVANAAAGTVTLVRIKDGDPDHFDWEVDENFYNKGSLATGSEPWSVVSSPDGRRIFVANSGQDTVTVIDARSRKLVGHVDLRNSLCNAPDSGRRFQPRGLAVTLDNTKLYVTRFLSFTKPGGQQGVDDGKEGLVCRIDIDTRSTDIGDFQPAAAITLAHQKTGFRADTNNDGQEDADTFAYPNQLQTIVLRGDQAFLPNIAASPSPPLKFNGDTQAFVNVIDGVTGGQQTDASATKFLNLHLGAQDPETVNGVAKKKLFFANAWDMAFTTPSGDGTAYVVSAGSDLLVKVNVAGDGKLSLTADENTTRYIDLNDPSNPATSGANAGKNPQGISITGDGKYAFVANFVSRNMSVVKLDEDKVVATVQTSDLPAPGTKEEEVIVGAEMFFSSRGHFDVPAGAAPDFSADERLSNLAWQSCSSCHFKGLTDGVVWTFPPGPRKSIPLNGTFNPHSATHAEQRVLNYSAQRINVEDFELNIRNVSGPGPLANAVPCDGGTNQAVPTSRNDPKHGLLLGVGDVNTPPCVIQDLGLPNKDRAQLTVTLPGTGRQPIPALTALREWSKLAVRTPRGATKAEDVAEGRALFEQAGCAKCHGGDQWTVSILPADLPQDQTPPDNRKATEPPPFVGAPYLPEFLKDIGSYNLGVPGLNNPIAGFPEIGAVEKATGGLVGGVFNPAPDGLGIDANNDGKGNGFAVSSLLGIHLLPPYGHNGACETLACVLSDANHRTGKGTSADVLGNEADRAKLEAFLESIDVDTEVVPVP